MDNWFEAIEGMISEYFDYLFDKKENNSEIKKYFKEALCGEMEGASIANTCYAFGYNSAIVRSISDETLVNGSYKDFDFNLKKVCDTAAKVCAHIIERY